MEKEEIVKDSIWVSSTTNVGKLAGSITSSYEANKRDISLRIIGAGALSQAIKGVIISNRFFIKQGLVAMVMPSFQSIPSDKTPAGEVTTICLDLKIQKV